VLAVLGISACGESEESGVSKAELHSAYNRGRKVGSNEAVAFTEKNEGKTEADAETRGFHRGVSQGERDGEKRGERLGEKKGRTEGESAAWNEAEAIINAAPSYEPPAKEEAFEPNEEPYEPYEPYEETYNGHPTTEEFGNGNGYIVECVDGTMSDSGGIQGACSHHGGER
jgi:hypothetical protein